MHINTHNIYWFGKFEKKSKICIIFTATIAATTTAKTIVTIFRTQIAFKAFTPQRFSHKTPNNALTTIKNTK